MFDNLRAVTRDARRRKSRPEAEPLPRSESITIRRWRRIYRKVPASLAPKAGTERTNPTPRTPRLAKTRQTSGHVTGSRHLDELRKGAPPFESAIGLFNRAAKGALVLGKPLHRIDEFVE